MYLYRFCFFAPLFLISVFSFSQVAEITSENNNKHFYLSCQPTELLGVPRGGIKMGAEKIISPRIAIGLDVAYRFINTAKNQDLQPGEKERRTGFQLQPEAKWYFKKMRKRIETSEPRHALSLRLGYARYIDAFSNWRSFTDGAGNRYQKLTSYDRLQQNFDVSVLICRKFYFSGTQQNWGGELFTGIGVRQKIFEYKNLSPELNAEELRQNDENAIFSLIRDGGYPVFNLGVRVFYRL